MKLLKVGYEIPKTFQGDLNEDIVHLIRSAGSNHLVPEDLTEAKYLLRLIQKELEAEGRKFKKNRPIVQRAHLASTPKQFAEAIEDLDNRSESGSITLYGLYEGLCAMGAVNSNWETIP